MKRIMSLILMVLSFSLSCLSQDKLSYDSVFVSENTPSSAIYNKMCRFCTLYIKDINKKKCFDDVNKSIKCASSIPLNIDKMGYENTSGLIYFDLNLSIKDNECHVLINNFRHISNKYPDDFSIGDIYNSLPDKLTDLNGRSLSKARCNLVEVINPIAKEACRLKADSVFNIIYRNVVKNEPISEETFSPEKKQKNNFQFNFWYPKKTQVGIYKDNVNSKGHRFILTSGRTLDKPSSLLTCQAYLGSISSEHMNPIYELSFNLYLLSNDKLSVEKDSPILIKLSDGEILRLKVLSDAEDLFGYSYFITNSLVTSYSAVVSAEINDEVMNKIKIGISKIRFEVNNEPVDIILHKDNISNFLYQNYELLKEQVKLKKNYEDGF